MANKGKYLKMCLSGASAPLYALTESWADFDTLQYLAKFVGTVLNVFFPGGTNLLLLKLSSSSETSKVQNKSGTWARQISERNEQSRAKMED